MATEPRPAPAAGGVVIAAGRVLMLRKRLPPELRLPKGTVEPGESPAAAALREVAEETGFAHLTILAELGTQALEYRAAAGWQERRADWFLMTLADWTRQPRPLRDARRFAVEWLSPPAALDQITFASERAMLRAALERG